MSSYLIQYLIANDSYQLIYNPEMTSGSSENYFSDGSLVPEGTWTAFVSPFHVGASGGAGLVLRLENDEILEFLAHPRVPPDTDDVTFVLYPGTRITLRVECLEDGTLVFSKTTDVREWTEVKRFTPESPVVEVGVVLRYDSEDVSVSAEVGEARLLKGLWQLELEEVWLGEPLLPESRGVPEESPPQVGVLSTSEPQVHALIGAQFGDLEFDVGKSVRWISWFCDDVFILDVNLGTQRYWVINWTQTFPDAEHRVTGINYFVRPADFRKEQWEQYRKTFGEPSAEDWIIFIDGHEGFSVDNRTLPDDYAFAPFKSFLWREIQRAQVAGQSSAILPYYVFLRSDNITNVSYGITAPSPSAPTWELAGTIAPGKVVMGVRDVQFSDTDSNGVNRQAFLQSVVNDRLEMVGADWVVIIDSASVTATTASTTTLGPSSIDVDQERIGVPSGTLSLTVISESGSSSTSRPLVLPVVQALSVPYYHPYKGLRRLWNASALYAPDFDWSQIDTPVDWDVKAGTGSSVRTLSGAYIEGPDLASIAGATKLRVEIDCSLDDWTPAAIASLIGQQITGSNSWAVTAAVAGLVNSAMYLTAGGAATNYASSPHTFVDGSRHLLSVTWTASNGTNSTVQYKKDGVSFGTTVTGAVFPSGLVNSTQKILIGRDGNGSAPATGNFYGARIYANDVLVASPDFTWMTAGQTSVTDAQGNVWSLRGTASVVVASAPLPAAKAQIISYGYAHWNLQDIEPPATTVPPLTEENDDGWRMRNLLSGVRTVPGLPVGETWVSPSSDPAGLPGPWAPADANNPDPVDPVTGVPIPQPVPADASLVGIVTPMYDCVFRINMRDGVWYQAGVSGNIPLKWDEASQTWTTDYDPEQWTDTGVRSYDPTAVPDPVP